MHIDIEIALHAYIQDSEAEDFSFATCICSTVGEQWRCIGIIEYPVKMANISINDERKLDTNIAQVEFGGTKIAF